MQEIQETRLWFLGWENPLEEEMATHSGILAWKILGMEEPGRLKSTGLQRVGHDWALMHKLKPQRKRHTELCSTLCSETCFFHSIRMLGKTSIRSSGPTNRDSGSMGWQWWPWCVFDKLSAWFWYQWSMDSRLIFVYETIIHSFTQ